MKDSNSNTEEDGFIYYLIVTSLFMAMFVIIGMPPIAYIILGLYFIIFITILKIKQRKFN